MVKDPKIALRMLLSNNGPKSKAAKGVGHLRPSGSCPFLSLSAQKSRRISPTKASAVERSPEKAGVGGSIPSLATMFSISYKPCLSRFCSILFQ